MVMFDRRQILTAAASGLATALTTCIVTSGARATTQAPELRRLGLVVPPMVIEAPELGVPDLAGRTHKIGDYRGRITVISFWATWCPPCRKEMPTLARLSRELGTDGYAVLAVNVGDKEERVRTFLDQVDHDGLPVLLAGNSDLPSKWYIRGLPVTYVLNGEGQVVLGAIGERVWDSPEMISGLKSLS